ncbi:MAG: hypothetical protein SFY69_05550 [Planctomycetota bacterium]|nr:hypothetical protein [Planctomycetota bacterium]
MRTPSIRSMCVYWVGVAALLGVLCAPARGQCTTEWLDGWATPALTNGGSFNGVVRAMHVYDPDGSGPLGERLLVAGQFDNIEGTIARGIAEWDGARWTTLVQNVAVLNLDSVCVFNGEIVVGGQFSLGTGVLNVARWSGTAWQPFASGLPGRVRALAVWNGQLFAAGDFFNAGGDPSGDGIARWDGTQWRALGTGLVGPGGAQLTVRALLVTPAALVVGGDFATAGGLDSPDVASWDGAAWHAMPGLASAGGRVNALANHSGSVYAGGILPNGSAVASWDGDAGSWTILPSQASGELFTLASLGGVLYAGGNLTAVNGVPLPTRLAKWDANAFTHAADTGPLLVFPLQQPLALAPYAGRLVVGGLNVGYRATGGTELQLRSCLLEYDGAEWLTFAKGLDGAALDFEQWGEDLVLAGPFRMAGGRRVNGVTRWDGATFRGMGQGLFSNTTSATGEIVSDLHAGPDGRLYAAGQFAATDGGSFLGGVAVWDGTAWRRTVQSPSGNPSGQMYDFATFEGALFVTGNGAVSGSVRGILRYTGLAWESTGWVLSTGPRCIEPVDGVLLAGSYQWSGSAWPFVPGSPQNIVQLRRVNGSDYALCEGGFPASSSCVAERRDGAWVPLGSGFTTTLTNSLSGSLDTYRGDLLAARAFNVAGMPTARVARYDGVGWRALPGDPSAQPPGDLSQTPRASSTFVDADGVLWVSGVFRDAGGRPSPYLARYRASPAPVFVDQPADAGGCAGDTAMFTASASDGAALRWRRNGVALSEGQILPGGGVATGVSTATLTITAPGPADSGTIDCVATTDCGSARSVAAMLAVTDCCDPDFNQDGSVDQFDVLCLVLLVGGDTTCSPRDADYNRDGNVDQSDIATLVQVVAGGPCP